MKMHLGRYAKHNLSGYVKVGLAIHIGGTYCTARMRQNLEMMVQNALIK